MHRAFCRLGDALGAVEGGEVDFDFVPLKTQLIDKLITIRTLWSFNTPYSFRVRQY